MKNLILIFLLLSGCSTYQLGVKSSDIKLRRCFKVDNRSHTNFTAMDTNGNRVVIDLSDTLEIVRWHNELRIHRKDGTIITLDISKAPTCKRDFHDLDHIDYAPNPSFRGF